MNFFDKNKWILLAALGLVTALSGFWTNAYVSKLAYSHPVIKTLVVTKVEVHTHTVDHWLIRPDGTREHTREITDNTVRGMETAKSSTPSVLAGHTDPDWAAFGAWAPWEGTLMLGGGRNVGPLTIGASTPLPVGASLAGFSPRPWKWQDSQINVELRF